MSSTTLCRLVRAAVIAVAFCGAIVCCWALPSVGRSLAGGYPEFSHFYFPWLFFLWTASLPLFAVLGLVWKASTAIRLDLVFTPGTARLVKVSAVLILCDVAFFLTGNIVLLLLGFSHPGIVLVSLFVDVFGISLALAAAALARYLTKAAVLQEESEGTI